MKNTGPGANNRLHFINIAPKNSINCTIFRFKTGSNRKNA